MFNQHRNHYLNTKKIERKQNNTRYTREKNIPPKKASVKHRKIQEGKKLEKRE